MYRATALLGCLVVSTIFVVAGNDLHGQRASAAGPTTVVVSPGNMHAWAFGPDAPYYPGTGSLVAGPAVPPAGLGSAHMVLSGATCPSGPTIANPCEELLLGLGATTYGGTLLSNITALSYSTYQSSAGVTAISLQFDIAYDVSDPNWQGRLVFEPYEDPANTVLSGTWQTWTPKSGRWWATKNAASPAHPGLISGLGGKDTCTQATPCTWAQLLANWPNMGIRTGDTFLFKAGGPWPGFDGYVDNFTIGISGADTVYDFEATCATDCYVRTDGNDANPGTADTPALAKKTIQAAVTALTPGGTVHIAAGTYVENVTVAKPLTLAGAGQALTTVQPALSGPTCVGGSICPGGSNVILVGADNVTIHDLTVDGDNPALTSGVVAGGADIEARNGIIANYPAGVFNNLTVHHVTVKNIYLRGIYAASGGTFNFHDDTVQNVQANPASIAMFNFGGSGTFANNTVSGANDGISSNWSKGTQYLNNVITASGSGVHTDNNGGSGGVADLIQGNTVSACKIDGYGIWTFAPYVSPTVTQNVVTGCAVGMAAAGQSAAVSTTFSDNAVDGTGALVTSGGATGLYVTTDRFGFGTTNVAATLTGNIIKNNAVGIDADAQAGYTTTINATHNAIVGNTAGVTLTNTPTPPVVLGIGTFVLNMTPNWWGDASGPAHALNPGGTGNSVPNGVVYSPWLGIGTDASVAPGFQLASPMTWIAGPAVCGATCIQAAIDDAANGDTVKAKTGVFPEHVIVNKSITLTAASNPIVDGGGIGDGITVTVPNVTVSLFEVRNVANGIVVAPGANNATIATNNVHNFTSAAVRASSVAGASIATNTVSGGHVGSCVGGFWGIIVQNVSGAINANTVSGIGNGITSGCQEGRAIEADGAGAVQITNNVLSQYQKSGIIVRDTVNATITGNTATGEGPSNFIAMNGITITSTGTASVTGNHTSGHLYTPESDFSCGILYFPVGNPAPNSVSITGNDSTQDEVGICLTNGTATSPVSGVVVTGNTITKHHQRAIDVETMANVLVDNNRIDGQGGGTTATPGTTPDNDTRYYGVFAIDSTGTISRNVVKGITHGVANGLQSGVGIRLTARSGKSADMAIVDNTISDVQKNAVVVTNYYGGTAVNALIRGNAVAGNGPISYIAQNGIQVSNGATALVDANDVTGYDYVPSTWAAVGILVYGAGTVSVTNNNVHGNMEGLFVQSTNNIVVTGNVFTATRDTAVFTYLSNGGTYTSNRLTGQPGSYGLYLYDASTNNTVSDNAFRANDYGVYVDYTGPGLPTGNHLNQNCIAGNTIAGVATLGTVAVPVDAKQNWWGTINGADPPGHGDKILPPATIDASAFLTTPTAGCPTPTDSDGDGVPNVSDNCPNTYNPAQANTDGANYLASRAGSDGLGDACDPNIAGDGYADTVKTALGKNVMVYCPIMRADVNGDHSVNILDLAMLASALLQPVPPSGSLSGLDVGVARLNQNADGSINILDLAAVAGVYLHSVTECP